MKIFLSLPPKDQIEMINQSLKLDSVNSLTDFLHIAINSYKLLRSHLDIIIKDSSIKDEENKSTKIDCNTEYYKTLKSSIESIDSEIELKSTKKVELDSKWNHLNIRDLSIPMVSIDEEIEALNAELESLRLFIDSSITKEILYEEKGLAIGEINSMNKVLTEYNDAKITDTSEEFDPIPLVTSIKLNDFLGLKRECIQWKKENADIVKQLGNLTSLEMVFEKLQAVTHLINDKKGIISSSEESKKDLEQQELDLTTELAKIDPQLLIKPRIEYVEVRARLKEIYNIKKTIDRKKEKYKELEEFFKIIDELNAELQGINVEIDMLNEQICQIDSSLEGCPYNADCEACRSQPLRIQRKKISEKLSEFEISASKIKESYQSHIKKHNIEKKHAELYDLEIWLKEASSKLEEEAKLDDL